MKKLYGIVFCLASFLVSLNLVSCDGDNPIGGYIVIRNFSDFQKIVATDAPQIVDYRCRDSFAVGHIRGAVNIEATPENTQNQNSGFCQAIKKRFRNDRSVFLYGDDSKFPEGFYVPGIVSDLGWGKNGTYYFLPGYKGWVENGGEIEK